MRRNVVLSMGAGALTSEALAPLHGRLVEVHVIDGPRQIKNYDDTYVGRVQGWHVSNPDARRTSAGDGSITLDTHQVRWRKYQIVTITELIEKEA